MTKIVICGAGIAGLALAHRLAHTGYDVVVLERAPAPRAQGYMIDFFGPGYDAAEAMGLLPRLHALAHDVHTAAYVDETGRRRATLPFERIAKNVGGRLLSIMRPDLERALREQLPQTVQLRFDAQLTHIDNGTDGVRVTLADSSTLDADLLVGADGIHSTVRELIFGAEHRYLRYLGFHTAAFTFHSPDIHSQVRGKFCLTDTIDRQFAFYGLDDDRVATFTVHRTADPTLPGDPQAALREVYGSMGWGVAQALAQCPPPDQVYYDQVAQVEVPEWSCGRVTLLGDACQAVSLLAGQGASLGIAGAYVLAEQLTAAPSIDTGLRRYEQLWRPIVDEKQRAARHAVRWFLPRSSWQLWLRRIALWTARVPGLDAVLTGAIAGKPTAIVRDMHAASSQHG